MIPHVGAVEPQQAELLQAGNVGRGEVNEATLDPCSELVLSALLGPSALFVIGTFFLLAGQVAELAVARKGAVRFAADRLLRLGLPFLVFDGLVWPLSMWSAYRTPGYRVSYWWAFTRRQPLLDSGRLWFVEVLPYISLGYAAGRWAAGRLFRSPDRPVVTAVQPHNLRQHVCIARVVDIGLIAKTSYPAATSEATHGPRSVSIPTLTRAAASASASSAHSFGITLAIKACSRVTPSRPSGRRRRTSRRPCSFTISMS